MTNLNEEVDQDKIQKTDRKASCCDGATVEHMHTKGIKYLVPITRTCALSIC